MSEDPQAKEKAKDELRLEIALTPIFAKFIREYRRSLARGGGQLSPLFSLEDTIEVLERRYGLIQQRTKDGALQFSLSPHEDVEQRYEQMLEQWKQDTSQSRAQIISRTNTAQGKQAEEEAVNSLVEDGEDPTNLAVAATASAFLARKFKTRRKIIAQTEVQAAYESTKHLKGQAITESSELNETKTVVDTWNSLLDGNERLSHNTADGQERVSPGAFSVGGVELRFPGDPFGPTREIIGCRCYLTSKVLEK